MKTLHGLKNLTQTDLQALQNDLVMEIDMALNGTDREGPPAWRFTLLAIPFEKPKKADDMLLLMGSNVEQSETMRMLKGAVEVLENEKTTVRYTDGTKEKPYGREDRTEGDRVGQAELKGPGNGRKVRH